MKIDRHNYEEYFLLYIDNELNIDQKGQVEQFVKENPDLEEELVMLQQSKLVPDSTIVFDKKDLLIKNENDSFINLNNYEEWLVLYVDDELNEEEKIVVEKFVAAHPKVQQELELFKQTKLEPEEIVFANKKVLYRKEKVTVISMQMQWWRVAVAAILIVAAGMTLYSVLNNRNNKTGTPGEIAKTGTKKEQSPNSAKTILPNQQEQATSPGKEIKNNIATTQPVIKENTTEKQHRPVKETNQQLAINSHVSESNTEVPELAITEIKERINQPKISDAIINNDKLQNDFFNAAGVTNSSAKTLDNSNTPNNGVIYASNTDNNENKRLRGFFRKATRFIERTTNINAADDDNKVLIGGMAINLK